MLDTITLEESLEFLTNETRTIVCDDRLRKSKLREERTKLLDYAVG